MLLHKSANVDNSVYYAILTLIYVSRETFAIGDSNSQLWKLVGYVAMVFLAGYFYLASKRSRVRNTTLPTLVVFSILCIATMIINLDVSFKYFYVILLLIICSLITKWLPFQIFRAVFTDIIYWLGVFSIGVYFLYVVSPSFFSVFPIVENEVGLQRYFCLFCVVGPEEYSIPRNSGIFREPGVFIIYLCLALMFELTNKKPRKLRLGGLLLAIVTTFSTAGYVTAAFIILSSFCLNRKISRSFKIKVLLLIALGIVLVSAAFPEYSLLGLVFGKLFYSNDSTASRLGSISANLYILLHDPISFTYGVGYTYMENNFEVVSALMKAGDHNTNSGLRLLAVHGVFYGTLYYAGLFKFCFRFFSRMGLFCFVAILLLWSNEDIMTSFLIYIFVFYGMKRLVFKTTKYPKYESVGC